VTAVPDNIYYDQYGANRQLPISAGSWHEGFHDPYDWAMAFSRGIGWLSFPNDEFWALKDQAVSEMDAIRRAEVYAEFNRLYDEQALAVLLFQTPDRRYEQRWVEGWYYNPAYAGNYYYVLSKQ
jgi:ABC-type transport system substrate-binding protein